MFPMCESILAHNHETQKATVSSVSELIFVDECTKGFEHHFEMFHVNTKMSQKVALRLLKDCTYCKLTPRQNKTG